MTIRILADREPYSSYADAPGSPTGSCVILNGPAGLDDPSPDILVLPSEDFFALGRRPGAESGGSILYIPYGPVENMEKAFEQGCSDYIREPWSLPELRARGGRFATMKFRIGDRILELRGANLAGKRASTFLSETERALLVLLIQNAPLPVPREAASSSQIRLVSEEGAALSRCVSSLRRKMETVEPGLGRRLLAIRGFGYRLEVTSCG